MVLVDLCRDHGSRYTGIDPECPPSILNTGEEDVVVFQARSLEILPTLAPHDLYFIDGDHNYYTVRNELRLILKERHHWPIILVHDIGWPYGRRDQYCRPESIPAEHRHSLELSTGILPRRDDSGEDSRSGAQDDYQCWIADHEGGPGNGVLTAVEDFMIEKSHEGWQLIHIPAVFGLGILFAPAHCTPHVYRYLNSLAAATRELHPLLDRLEANRVTLLFAYLKGIRDFGGLHAEYGTLQSANDGLLQHSTHLTKSYDTLHAEYDALLHEYHALDAHAKALQLAYDDLHRHFQMLLKAGQSADK
jgi:hypothetical protein